MKKGSYSLETKYGVYIASAIFIWMLLQLITGLHTTFLFIGQFTIFLTPIVLLVGLSKYVQAKHHARRKVDFKARTKLAFFLALSMFLFFYVYAGLLNTAWLEVNIDFTMNRLNMIGFSQEEVSQWLDKTQLLYTLHIRAALTFVSYFIATIVLTPLFKKKKHHV